jgi:hypothetical protein
MRFCLQYSFNALIRLSSSWTEYTFFKHITFKLKINKYYTQQKVYILFFFIFPQKPRHTTHHRSMWCDVVVLPMWCDVKYIRVYITFILYSILYLLWDNLYCFFYVHYTSHVMSPSFLGR